MDFYVILGLNREATQGDVERAFKHLARRYHPDINPGDREAEAFFRRVTEAYETLSHPDRRQEYDTHGVRAHAAERMSVEFQGFDFSAPVTGISATFGELFFDVFQATGEREVTVEAGQGSDLYGEISLSFEEALLGAEHRLTVMRLDVCAACSGAGKRRGVEERCIRCHGAGTTSWRRGHMVFSKLCQNCGGSGRLRHRSCVACRADGVVPRNEDITINVPAGVADGARLRVAAKGNAGRRRAQPGDLYITAKVSSHGLFQREGHDLHIKVPIAIHEAALGAKIEVPTVDGSTRLRIPPGTQSGQRFRLSGRGAPSPRTGARGDFVVEVQLMLPPVQDERSKELLREFGRIHSDDVRKDLFTE